MENNPGDVMVGKILEKAHLVSNGIARQLKNTKPFAKDGLSPISKIWAIEHIHPIDMVEIQKEFGDEAIGNLIYEIEKLKADGRRQ